MRSLARGTGALFLIVAGAWMQSALIVLAGVCALVGELWETP